MVTHESLSDTSFYVSSDEQVEGMSLSRVNGQLALASNHLDGLDLTVDFFSNSFIYRLHTSGLKVDVAKACGLKKGREAVMPSILDLTAGLGTDAITLTYLGATVSLLERNAYVYAILNDGINRAKGYDLNSDDCVDSNITAQRLFEAINQRLTLLPKGDSITYLEHLKASGDAGKHYDVIYFDPMFPARKKSAKVKKNMQYFHAVVGEDVDQEASVLSLARDLAVKRVVVKRPKQAEFIDHQKPSYSIASKTLRFDIYLAA